jgi:hypothetical protein
MSRASRVSAFGVSQTATRRPSRHCSCMNVGVWSARAGESSAAPTRRNQDLSPLWRIETINCARANVVQSVI